MYGDDYKVLIGKKIQKIFISEKYLRFVTDQGIVDFTVSGDCCSRSYYNDFMGVKKLLDNGPVKEFSEIKMSEYDQEKAQKEDSDDYGGDYGGDLIVVYGVRIITENPHFGDQTSVISFRNASNGYYGGSMDVCMSVPNEELPKMKELTEDWITN